MNAGWAAVILGSLIGGGGTFGMVWRAARLAALLEHLVETVADHETRIRHQESISPRDAGPSVSQPAARR